MPTNCKRETPIAVFDFDGTLTYRDTLIPFLCSIFGKPRVYATLLTLAPKLSLFLLRLLSRRAAKELILKAFLKGMQKETLEKYARRFAREDLPKLIRKEGMKCMEKHRAAGHRCVLISANLALYLTPWGKKNGFHEILASEIEFDPHLIATGLLKGENCWGEEKVRRFRELFGVKKHPPLYVYGDSQGDRPLLDLADFPYYRTFSKNL